MEARIEVRAEHLGGPSTVCISAQLEPNQERWNEDVFDSMAIGMNRLLAALFDQRDHEAHGNGKMSLGEDRSGDTPTLFTDAHRADANDRVAEAMAHLQEVGDVRD